MRRPQRRSESSLHCKPILTATERKHMQAEIHDLELQLRNVELSVGGWNPGMPRMENEADVRRRYQKLKARLEAGTPEDLTAKRKRAIDKEIRLLEEELGRDMVPNNFYHQKQADSNDYHKTVKALVMENDPARVQKVMRLKYLRRERDPDNPDAGNIEELRKARPIKIPIGG